MDIEVCGASFGPSQWLSVAIPFDLDQSDDDGRALWHIYAGGLHVAGPMTEAEYQAWMVEKESEGAITFIAGSCYLIPPVAGGA